MATQRIRIVRHRRLRRYGWVRQEKMYGYFVRPFRTPWLKDFWPHSDVETPLN